MQVGFESQKRLAAAEERKNFDETRKQAAEIRHQEWHAARIAAKTPHHRRSS